MPRTGTLLALAAVATAACGNARTPAPSLTRPAAPDGFRMLAYPSANLRFDAPRNWIVSNGRPPLLATVTSATATVALWRYLRPRSAVHLVSQLAQAKAALIASARLQEPGLHVIRAQTTRIAGVPAVVLDAVERIGGSLRRVCSIHLYAPALELVVEEYAPPAIFDGVDRAVFSPLKRSLAPLFSGNR